VLRVWCVRTCVRVCVSVVCVCVCVWCVCVYVYVCVYVCVHKVCVLCVCVCVCVCLCACVCVCVCVPDRVLYFDNFPVNSFVVNYHGVIYNGGYRYSSTITVCCHFHTKLPGLQCKLAPPTISRTSVLL
jgi:hypothetical protein